MMKEGAGTNYWKDLSICKVDVQQLKARFYVLYVATCMFWASTEAFVFQYRLAKVLRIYYLKVIWIKILFVKLFHSFAYEFKWEKNYSTTRKDHTDSSQEFKKKKKKDGFPKTHIKGTLDSGFPALLEYGNGLSKQMLSLNLKYVWRFLRGWGTTFLLQKRWEKDEEGKHLQFIELTKQCMPYPIIGIGVDDGEIQADIRAHSRFLNISFHLFYYIHHMYGKKLIAEVNLKSSKK